MKKRLIVVTACVLLILIIAISGGVWLWLHLLAPPVHFPLPNTTLSLITEPQDGITPVLSIINNATSSIELVMYELTDTQIEQALVAAQRRGVSVRVLLNEGYYGAPSTANTSAYELPAKECCISSLDAGIIFLNAREASDCGRYRRTHHGI